MENVEPYTGKLDYLHIYVFQNSWKVNTSPHKYVKKKTILYY